MPAKGRTAGWLRGVVEAEGFGLGAVNVVFCSRERHLEINRSFLGHDWPTDVITFDYSGSEGDCSHAAAPSGGRKLRFRPCSATCVSGDIFIDPRTVEENAERFLAAPQVEMRRVMVHGVLHLCGYGDKSVREQRRMRAKEDFYLGRFYSA